LECKESNAYYRPLNYNYGGNDSFILDVGYFQITISLDYGVTTQSIKEIKEVLKMDNFYFTAPITSYKRFEEQRCIRSTTSKGKEMIEQYVLSISLEPNFALWLSRVDPERNPKVLAQEGGII
jgi:hypothetical protein